MDDNKVLNTRKYIENFVYIRNKKSRMVLLHFNEPQAKLYRVIQQQHEQHKPIRVIILKARQMGFSTATGGIIFKQVATHRNVDAAIVAHTEQASTNLFNMYKLMYDNLPPELRPSTRASNAKEIIFDNQDSSGLNSKIKCMAAGTKGLGRSMTLKYLHISELAFWEGNVAEQMNGLFQAVPNTPDSMIIVESTANGYEYYKEMWDKATRGENDFYPLFIGWNELKEYSMPYTGFPLTDEEKALMSTHNLTLDQLEWRRWCIRNNCNGDTDLFRQEYPITPDEAFIATGRCAFDQEKIVSYLPTIPPPLRTGYFEYQLDLNDRITSFDFIESPHGPIEIYSLPSPGIPYVIGADTAGEGSDYFYATLLDNSTGIECARYRYQTDETLFAREMYCLGRYYNDALMAVEANFSTYPIKELERLRYPKQFVRIKEDKYTHSALEQYGFKTTTITRPLIINLVRDVIRDHITTIKDRIMLQEAITFVINEKGRAEAIVGKHDDGVMSYGIALYARGQQKTVVKDKHSSPVKFKWPEDLLEDYYKADKFLKERMIEKYGKPSR